MTYGEFKTLMAGYLHRDDLTSYLPGFIESGRIRLFAELRVSEMEQVTDVVFSLGEAVFPDDLVDIRSLSDAEGEWRRVELEAVVGATSERWYSVIGLTLRAPAADTLSLVYYARPETFIGDVLGDSATRPLLDAYPYLWMQAALAEAYRFLEDPEAEARTADRLSADVASANYRSSELRQGIAPAVGKPYRVDLRAMTR